MSELALLTTSFAITLALLFVLAPLAQRIGLVDEPDHRKPHRGRIPLVGGIAVFLGILGACVLWGGALHTDLGVSLEVYGVFLLAFAAVIVIGIVDDLRGMRVTTRVLVEFAIVVVLIEGAGLRLIDLGDLLGFGAIVLPQWVTYPFLMIAIFGIVNAYNMLDGMDGLLSFNTLITLLAFHSLAGVPWGPGTLAVAAGLVAFLVSNLGLVRAVPKTFLGDAGSKFLGLFVAVLLVTAASGSVGDKVIYPVTALYVAGLPLMDMVFVTLRRVAGGRSPFAANRDHIHHLTRALGLGTFGSIAAICGVGITLPLLGMVLRRAGAPDPLQFGLFMGLFLLYCLVMTLLWQAVERAAAPPVRVEG